MGKDGRQLLFFKGAHTDSTVRRNKYLKFKLLHIEWTIKGHVPALDGLESQLRIPKNAVCVVDMNSWLVGQSKFASVLDLNAIFLILEGRFV